MTAQRPADAVPGARGRATADAAPSDALSQAGHARLVAVVHLDMVGYSRLMGLDEASTLVRLRTLRDQVLRPMVAEAGGHLVNTAGDSALLTFGSVVAAVHCALAFQAAVARREAEVPADRAMRFRVGVTVADVLTDGMDVLGDGVNVAARLQTACPPGAVCTSRAVREQLRGRLDVEFDRLGGLALKNIARPVEAYLVRPRRHDARRGWWRVIRRRAGPGSRAVRWTVWATTPLIAGLIAAAVIVPVLRFAEGLDRRAGPAREAEAVAAFPAVPSAAQHELAERLTRQAESLNCPDEACPREWLAARTLLERAVALDPEYARAYADNAVTYSNFVAYGLSLKEKDDLGDAERLASRAIALAPSASFSYNARGAVLRQTPDRLDEALAAYLRSLAIEPNQPLIRANAGWLLILLGRPAQAEPFLYEALAEAPESNFAPIWLTRLGLAELFLDRPGHGTAQFRQALAQQSKWIAASDVALQRGLYLGAALALDGNLDKAHHVIDELRREHLSLSTQHPLLSIRALTLFLCDCSREPNFLAGLRKLRHGLVLAGVSDGE